MITFGTVLDGEGGQRARAIEALLSNDSYIMEYQPRDVHEYDRETLGIAY